MIIYILYLFRRRVLIDSNHLTILVRLEIKARQIRRVSANNQWRCMEFEREKKMVKKM